jgi:hypothetical protein
MKIRVAASALASLFWAASLFAQASNGSELTATGQLVSTGDMSLVVKADDGREQGPFIVTTTTQLPSGLAAGSRVTVFYHPVGDRQVADRVVPASAPAQPMARAPGRASGAAGLTRPDGANSLVP